MSPCATSCFACVVAVILCAMPELSQSQVCPTEKTENDSVDLQVALSKGVRGADPVHVASWEACVNVCCFGKSILANKKCNLVVFKPQRKGNFPNCYLFYCPTTEACPLKYAAGLVTYRTIQDAEVLKPTSSLNKSLDLILNGSFVSPEAVVRDMSRPTPPPNGSGSSQNSVTSRILNVPVDKSHQHSDHPKTEGAKPSESSDSRLTDQTISSQTQSNTSQNLVPIVQSTVELPAATLSIQASTVAVVPPGTAPGAAHSTPDYGKTHMTTVSARQSHPAPQPAATSQASSLISPPPTLPKKASFAVHQAHLRPGQLNGESDTLDGASGEKAPFLGDKTVLLAALLFGLIFLLVAQMVIGQKMLESLRHRRYSRLDYLINGMYANI